MKIKNFNKQFSETSSSTINDINLKSKYFKRKSFLLYDKKRPYSERNRTNKVL